MGTERNGECLARPGASVQRESIQNPSGPSRENDGGPHSHDAGVVANEGIAAEWVQESHRDDAGRSRRRGARAFIRASWRILRVCSAD